MVLGELSPWFIRIVALLFGLVWGSFLNVVIYRTPRGMSVVRPASRCPACGKPIAGYDNIPVFSYLILRGRARCCGARMSPRYPLVELLGGMLSLAIAQVIILRLDPETSVGRAAAIFGADFALAMGLIAAAFIDLEHLYLPDTVTIGGAILGVATSSFRDLSFVESLIGAGFGFGIIVGANLFYKFVRKRAGMGLGDAKLLMLAGAWFGWQGAFFVLFAGSIQGTIGALVVFFVQGKIEEPESVKADREELEKAAAEGDEEAKEILAEDPVLGDAPKEGLMGARISFGPFLILACLEFLFFGERIREAYGVIVSVP